MTTSEKKTQPIDVEKLTLMFQSMANQHRWNILRYLALSKEGLTVGTLAMGLQIKENLTGHHLSILVNAGLISRVQSGRYAIHRIKQEAVELLLIAILTLHRKEASDGNDRESSEHATEDHHTQPLGSGQDSVGSDTGS